MQDVNKVRRPPTKAEIEADRLAGVLSDERYKATIGAWLQEEKDNCLQEAMEQVGELSERAKGGFGALQRIFDRIELVLHRRTSAADKRAAQLQKDNDQ